MSGSLDEQGAGNAETSEGANLSPVICRFLRAKTAYGTLEGGENPWLLLDDAGTTVFKCLRTFEATGPDDYFAASDSCRRGRACFVPPAT